MDSINRFNFNGDYNKEEVIEYLEKLIRPKLNHALQEYMGYPSPEEQKEQLVELVTTYLDDQMGKGQKHVKIDVTATPEQIENYQYTVTLTALDEYGVELIKDMGTNE